MAKTIQMAADKWRAKMMNAGAKWKDAVSKADYCGPFDQFVGHSTPTACANWRAGVDRVSAADFQNSVTGKESKYIAGLEHVQ